MKKPLLLLSALALSSCAYAIDGAHQDVQVVTPGASNADCHIYVDDLKYQAEPPQTVNIFKSKKDLVVDCLAPGNRRKIVKVPATVETSTAWNAANAGVGLPWDFASEAMFAYPDVIEVDFTQIPVSDQPLPDHNSPDIRQPEEYPLEEFSPAQPRMNADMNAPRNEILRRDGSSVGAVQYNDTGAFSEAPIGGGKGDLMVPSSDSSVEVMTLDPTPLFPGE